MLRIIQKLKSKLGAIGTSAPGPNTTENGEVALEKDKVQSDGKMELNTLDNGCMDTLMAKGSFTMLTGTFMRENGETENAMVTVNT
jgi:hypothetical protein